MDPDPTERFMATPDPQLDGIRRAFDNAFRRIISAPTPKDAWHNKLVGSDDLRAARAAIWARTFDVHDVVTVVAMGDLYSEYYTAMYGVLVWKPLASLPEQTDKWGHDRHLDYRDFLKNRGVLGTTRRAFDAMAALL